MAENEIDEDIGPCGFGVSMRTRMMVGSTILLVVMVVACGSGISRLGSTDLSVRALRAARHWTAGTSTLSDLSAQIADRVISVLDFSPYIPPEDAGMLENAVRHAIRDEVRGALQGRRVQWSYSDPVCVGFPLYKVQCSTDVLIKVQIGYVKDGSRTIFNQTRTLHISIDLEVDADRMKSWGWMVTAWF